VLPVAPQFNQGREMKIEATLQLAFDALLRISSPWAPARLPAR
jgi:hypothetical protein